MSTMFSWRVVNPAPGEPVAPDERLPWGKTVGLGAQHVVAMFGATFVFPLVMGLDPNLAIMFSGICTILFLLVTSNRVPSYLGTSASFVASVAAIRAHTDGDSAEVTGAILVAGLVLAAVGVLVHFAGSGVIHKVLPPAVTGAVVMLIGFNLAPVVAGIYWPQDQWIALVIADVHGGRGGPAAGLLVADRGVPGADLRLRALVAGRPVVRDRSTRSPAPPPPPARRSTTTGSPGSGSRQPTGSASRAASCPDGVSVVHAPELLPDVHPARAAGRDRADRGEHRARQGRGRDDQDRPRPLHGQGVGGGRLRDRTLERVRRLADDDVRREHRGDGGDQGLLDGGVLRGGGRGHPARPVPEVRGDRRARPPVVCWAGSRWSCTA